jgi:TATA-box binding protein (TBP) (component of TFIID and TFIIIB)
MHNRKRKSHPEETGEDEPPVSAGTGQRYYSKRTGDAVTTATTPTTAVSSKPIRGIKIKALKKKIQLAEAEHKTEEAKRLRDSLPVRVPKSRAAVPLNGPPRPNQKNKKKFKTHKQTDHQYDITPMNHVVKCSTTPGVSLRDTRSSWAYAKYIQQRFPAASVILKEPRCVLSIYATGEMGIAGCKTHGAALIAAHLFDFRRAMDMNDEISIRSFADVNITTSFNIGIPLDLPFIYNHYDSCDDPTVTVTYDPDVIASLKFRKIDLIATAEAKALLAERKKLNVNHDDDDDDDEEGESTTVRRMTFNFFPTGRGCTIGSKSKEEWQRCGAVIKEIEALQRSKNARDAKEKEEIGRASCRERV